ncbi:toxin glutamine deamidase domain-containing protein [Verrucosispora sp. TAA-831]|uniref:WXG100-like domain-containing protein n=1 Tax=Verrucosispora sp. TAA-831 TaxID=3422227 RepID=UPI003D6F7DC6
MGIEASDDLAGFLKWISGEDFPGTDEDRLFGLSRAYSGAADGVDSALPLLVDAVRSIRRGVSGRADEAFVESMQGYLRNPGYLAVAADQLRDLGAKSRASGTQVQYVKMMIIGALIQLMIDFIVALAFSFFNPGAALNWLAARVAVFRFLVRTLLGRLIQMVAVNQVIGIGLQVLMDAIVQRLQLSMGTRDRWDGKLTRDAAAVGALGGAVSTFLGPAINLLARRLGGPGARALTDAGADSVPPPGTTFRQALTTPEPRPTGRQATADAAGEMASEAAVEYLTEGLYGVMTGQGWNVGGAAAVSGAVSGAASAAGTNIGDAIRPGPDGGTRDTESDGDAPSRTTPTPDPTSKSSPPPPPDASSAPDTPPPLDVPSSADTPPPGPDGAGAPAASDGTGTPVVVGVPGGPSDGRSTTAAGPVPATAPGTPGGRDVDRSGSSPSDGTGAVSGQQGDPSGPRPAGGPSAAGGPVAAGAVTGNGVASPPTTIGGNGTADPSSTGGAPSNDARPSAVPAAAVTTSGGPFVTQPAPSAAPAPPATPAPSMGGQGAATPTPVTAPNAAATPAPSTGTSPASTPPNGGGSTAAATNGGPSPTRPAAPTPVPAAATTITPAGTTVSSTGPAPTGPAPTGPAPTGPAPTGSSGTPSPATPSPATPSPATPSNGPVPVRPAAVAGTVATPVPSPVSSTSTAAPTPVPSASATTASASPPTAPLAGRPGAVPPAATTGASTGTVTPSLSPATPPARTPTDTAPQTNGGPRGDLRARDAGSGTEAMPRTDPPPDATVVQRDYPWLPGINPHRHRKGEFGTNCVLTAIVTDLAFTERLRPGERLQSSPSTLAPLEHLTRYRDRAPVAVADFAAVTRVMRSAPQGSRGIVVVHVTGRDFAHAFNVIHDHNGVVFLDGQNGTVADLTIQPDTVLFVPTTDGLPVDGPVRGLDVPIGGRSSDTTGGRLDAPAGTGTDSDGDAETALLTVDHPEGEVPAPDPLDDGLVAVGYLAAGSLGAAEVVRVTGLAEVEQAARDLVRQRGSRKVRGLDEFLRRLHNDADGSGDLHGLVGRGEHVPVTVDGRQVELRVSVTLDELRRTPDQDPDTVLTRIDRAGAVTTTSGVTKSKSGGVDASLTVSPAGAVEPGIVGGGLNLHATLRRLTQALSTLRSLVTHRQARPSNGADRIAARATYRLELWERAADGTNQQVGPAREVPTEAILKIPRHALVADRNEQRAEGLGPSTVPRVHQVEAAVVPELWRLAERTLPPGLFAVGSASRAELSRLLSARNVEAALEEFTGGLRIPALWNETTNEVAGPFTITAGSAEHTLRSTATDVVLRDSAQLVVANEHSAAASSSFGAALQAGWNGPRDETGVPLTGSVSVGVSGRREQAALGGGSGGRKRAVIYTGETELRDYPVTWRIQGAGIDEVSTEPDHLFVRAATDLPPDLPTGQGARLPDDAQVMTGPLGDGAVRDVTGLAEVLADIETVLRAHPGFVVDGPAPVDTIRTLRDLMEHRRNEESLRTALSQPAVRAMVDSLFDTGIVVELKRYGWYRNEYVRIVLTATRTAGRRTGQSQSISMRETDIGGDRAQAHTSVSRDYQAGIRFGFFDRWRKPSSRALAAAGVGYQYTRSNGRKLATGQQLAQVEMSVSPTPKDGRTTAREYELDLDFQVEVSSYTRPRALYRTVTGGLLSHRSDRRWIELPDGQHLDTGHLEFSGTPQTIRLRPGRMRIWLSELWADRMGVEEPAPRPDGATDDRAVPVLHDVTETAPPPLPFAGLPLRFHTEGVGPLAPIRDAALDLLEGLPHGDVLTSPGSASRSQIDAFFTPEFANGRTRNLISPGETSGTLFAGGVFRDDLGSLQVAFAPTAFRPVDPGSWELESSMAGSYPITSAQVTGGMHTLRLFGLFGHRGDGDYAGSAGLQPGVQWHNDLRTTTATDTGGAERNVVQSGAFVFYRVDGDWHLTARTRWAGASDFLTGQIGVRHQRVSVENGLLIAVALRDVQTTNAWIEQHNADPANADRQIPTLPLPPDPPTPPATIHLPPATGAPAWRIPDNLTLDSGDLGRAWVDNLGGPDLYQQIRDRLREQGVDLLPDEPLRDPLGNVGRAKAIFGRFGLAAFVDSLLSNDLLVRLYDRRRMRRFAFVARTTTGVDVRIRARLTPPRLAEIISDPTEIEYYTKANHTVAVDRSRGITVDVSGSYVPGRDTSGSDPENPPKHHGGVFGAGPGARLGHQSDADRSTATAAVDERVVTGTGPLIEFESILELTVTTSDTNRSAPIRVPIRLRIPESATRVREPVPEAPSADRPTGGPRALTSAQTEPNAVRRWQRGGTRLPTEAMVTSFPAARASEDAARMAVAAHARTSRLQRAIGTDPLRNPRSIVPAAVHDQATPEWSKAQYPRIANEGVTTGLTGPGIAPRYRAILERYARLGPPSLARIVTDDRMERPKQISVATVTQTQSRNLAGFEVDLRTGTSGINPVTRHDAPMPGQLGVGSGSAARSGTTANTGSNVKYRGRTMVFTFTVQERHVVRDPTDPLGDRAGAEVTLPGTIEVQVPEEVARANGWLDDTDPARRHAIDSTVAAWENALTSRADWLQRAAEWRAAEAELRDLPPDATDGRRDQAEAEATAARIESRAAQERYLQARADAEGLADRLAAGRARQPADVTAHRIPALPENEAARRRFEQARGQALHTLALTTAEDLATALDRHTADFRTALRRPRSATVDQLRHLATARAHRDQLVQLADQVRRGELTPEAVDDAGREPTGRPGVDQRLVHLAEAARALLDQVTANAPAEPDLTPVLRAQRRVLRHQLPPPGAGQRAWFQTRSVRIQHTVAGLQRTAARLTHTAGGLHRKAAGRDLHKEFRRLVGPGGRAGGDHLLARAAALLALAEEIEAAWHTGTTEAAARYASEFTDRPLSPAPPPGLPPVDRATVDRRLAALDPDTLVPLRHRVDAIVAARSAGTPQSAAALLDHAYRVTAALLDGTDPHVVARRLAHTRAPSTDTDPPTHPVEHSRRRTARPAGDRRRGATRSESRRTDAPATRDRLRADLLGGLSQERRNDLDDRIRLLGLDDGQPVMLLWVRRPAPEPGTYPEPDLPDVLLEQLAGEHQTRHPTGRVLLIGDDPGPALRNRRPDLFTDPHLTGAPPTADPNADDRADQAYLLDRLRQDGHRPLLSVDVSGDTADLSALLGIDTVHLERGASRGDPTDRVAHSGGAPDGPVPQRDASVSTWRRQRFEAPTEWLVHHARLAHIVDQLPADATVAQRRTHLRELWEAVDDWRQTVTEQEVRLTASADDAPDWIGRGEALAESLLAAYVALDPEAVPAHLPDPLVGPVLDHRIAAAHALIVELDPTRYLRLTPGELDRIFAPPEGTRRAGHEGPPDRSGRDETTRTDGTDQDDEDTHGVPLGWQARQERGLLIVETDGLRSVDRDGGSPRPPGPPPPGHGPTDGDGPTDGRPEGADLDQDRDPAAAKDDAHTGGSPHQRSRQDTGGHQRHANAPADRSAGSRPEVGQTIADARRLLTVAQTRQMVDGLRDHIDRMLSRVPHDSPDHAELRRLHERTRAWRPVGIPIDVPGAGRLRLRDVPDDRDCLFWAVLEASRRQRVPLPGDPAGPAELRARAADLMAQQPARFEPHLGRTAGRIIADQLHHQHADTRLTPGWEYVPPTAETRESWRAEAELDELRRRARAHDVVGVDDLTREDLRALLTAEDPTTARTLADHVRTAVAEREQRQPRVQWLREVADRIDRGDRNVLGMLAVHFTGRDEAGNAEVVRLVLDTVERHGRTPSGVELLEAAMRQRDLWNSAIGDDLPTALAVALDLNIVVVPIDRDRDRVPFVAGVPLPLRSEAHHALYLARSFNHFQSLEPTDGTASASTVRWHRSDLSPTALRQAVDAVIMRYDLPPPVDPTFLDGLRTRVQEALVHGDDPVAAADRFAAVHGHLPTTFQAGP